MTRCQLRTDVYFFEEPLFEDQSTTTLRVMLDGSGVHVLTPVLPLHTDALQATALQRSLLEEFLRERRIERYFAWYFTPMALRFAGHLTPELIIYDCMDELSAFQGAPPELVDLERQLFSRADAVFVGGRSLYEVKQTQHTNVHLFPSSIDREFFGQARGTLSDPLDQGAIPHPRIGFFGVLDERLDRELLAAAAATRPDWHFVVVGPVVKISADDLPRFSNIHYLGQKPYTELPHYIANWEVAMLPFAVNGSTRFISPTKTPEYLAAGKPVVSTPIQDVIEPYGRLDLVSIAATTREFVEAIERLLQAPEKGWLGKVDHLLSRTSWDNTFHSMWCEILRLAKIANDIEGMPSSAWREEITIV